MKLIPAFFRMIRWQNLFFIMITQLLFYTCIFLPVMSGGYHGLFGGTAGKLDTANFLLLVLSSVLIAAAGYIINDYFDLNIDQVNKPGAIIIQKIISRRWAIAWHLLLSGAGIGLSFFLSWKFRNPIIGFANTSCVLLLWLYSTTFKKQLLTGNVLISLLTAWVIMVIYFAELSVGRLDEILYRNAIKSVFKYAIIYSGFAFIITIIREVVKDMEDRMGDEKYGCRTIPIVWGFPTAKMYAFVWIFILISAILIILFYGLLKGWWLGALYTFGFVIVPLVRIVDLLRKANSPEMYHQISTQIKWVMLAGILSMAFFKWYL